MEHILDVAQFLIDEYHRVYDQKIGKLKLQKLLYLAQRESYAVSGELLFSETMQGWTYGPVSLDVRRHFDKDRDCIETATHAPSETAIYLLKNVVLEYGHIDPWELVDLTQAELSWKNARQGLAPEDKGDTPLDVEDIKKDAEKVRPYDHVWDMYYDEFDDYVPESATV